MSKRSVLRLFVKNLYCEIKDIQIGKEEMNTVSSFIYILLFTDDMYVFIENLKESTNNSQHDCRIQEYAQKSHPI